MLDTAKTGHEQIGGTGTLEVFTTVPTELKIHSQESCMGHPWTSTRLSTFLSLHRLLNVNIWG